MNGACDCCGAPVSDWNREECGRCEDERARGKHNANVCATEKQHRDGLRRGVDVVDKPPDDLPENLKDFLRGGK